MFKTSRRTFAFVSKGCGKNWYPKIEADIYDFVFAEGFIKTDNLENI